MTDRDLRVELALPAEVVEEIVALVTAQVLDVLVTPGPVLPYMTIPEAAEHLRTDRQRIDDLLSSGRLSRVKEGGRTLLLREEIEQYLVRAPRSTS